MEKSLETSASYTILSTDETILKTPPRNQSLPTNLNSPISLSIPSDGSHKNGTPDRLKVPKPFKFPERYTSPTDAMMSPVSKRLHSKSRKPALLLPPTLNLHHEEIQIQESRLSDMGLLQS